jgi:hypothetical protein
MEGDGVGYWKGDSWEKGRDSGEEPLTLWTSKVEFQGQASSSIQSNIRRLVSTFRLSGLSGLSGS